MIDGMPQAAEAHVHKANSENPLLRQVAPWIATVGLGIGAVAALGLILYVFVSDPSAYKTLLNAQVRAIVGIPLAALSAFSVVFVFEATSGRIEFEIGPLKFRGASGPAVIWVFAFMAIVGAIVMLWS
jgi:hypothetical protein